jgi:proteasome activator subunit 4
MDEIDFVILLLEKLGNSWLDRLDTLIASVKDWDSIARNDFCRLFQFARSIWNSLTTFIKLPCYSVPEEWLERDVDIPELLFPRVDVNAG